MTSSAANALHIVHIVTRNQPGGSARNIGAQLEWEVEQGCRVELVVGGHEAGAAIPPGVTVHRVHKLVREPNPWKDTQAAVHLWRLIRDCEPAIVHTHQSKAGLLGRLAARSSGAVLVHTVHMASFGPGYSRGLSWVSAWAERRCAQFTDFMITVGEELRSRYLSAGVGTEEQYSVVRSPAGIEPFLQTRILSAEDRISLRRQLGLPIDSSIVIAAGLLEKRKRFDMAIDQLSPLLGGKGTHLIIAGAGPEHGRLLQLAERRGVAEHVQFIGHVDNLPDYFAVANVLVHTSLTEGLPQVVVQALAAGLPIVATNAEGLAELQPSPLTCIDRNGEGLLRICTLALAAPRPEPIQSERLSPWTVWAVSQMRASMHQRFAEAVQLRKQAS